jgi:hypothetical protein
LIDARQYVLDSEWGDIQPKAPAENAFLESHSWEEYGDFRRLHRSGLIACHYRAAEWRHKEIELAAHDLLQLLDSTSS